MMVGPGEHEESSQQRRNARFARGRLGLSASHDATLAEPKLDEDESMEEDEIAQPQSRPMLIGPRLILQSKQLPAVTAFKEGVTEAPVAVKAIKDSVPVREKLAGSGRFLQGHAEVTVENAHVTPASVVIVTLLGDPGPVVVQYYTLLPGFGFTVHLSSPAKTDTPFNYVILLGELF